MDLQSTRQFDPAGLKTRRTAIRRLDPPGVSPDLNFCPLHHDFRRAVEYRGEKDDGGMEEACRHRAV